MNENHFNFSLIHKQRRYGDISDDISDDIIDRPMESAVMCAAVIG